MDVVKRGCPFRRYVGTMPLWGREVPWFRAASGMGWIENTHQRTGARWDFLRHWLFVLHKPDLEAQTQSPGLFGWLAPLLCSDHLRSASNYRAAGG